MHKIFYKKNYLLSTLLFLLSGCITPEKDISWCLYPDNCKVLQEIKTKKSTHDQKYVVIIIDVFRASSTAAHVLDRYPASYVLAKSSDTIIRILPEHKNPLLIGKPEKGANLKYHIPNSPTRVLEHKITGRTILHRTNAGAKGLLLAKNADVVLLAGFVNASATAKYIKKLLNAKILIVPMGHEGTTRSLEDELCGRYIESLINGNTINLGQFLPELKQGPGKYFFNEDQQQYPRSDFDLCLELNRFNFVIKAFLRDDHAILVRCDQTS